MPRPSVLLLSLAALVGLAGAAGAQPAARGMHALVVAVGEYPRPVNPRAPRYNPLNSANDTTLVAGALRRHGFRVEVLADRAATKAGIVAALGRLRERARAGDVVFVHYSGHGHQVTDASGDEPDGYDEMLVPYDAPAGPPAGYTGAGHLTDDELERAVDGLRQRLHPGGELVMTFDACHSGSGTRGNPTRTGGDPIGPPGRSARAGADETGVVALDPAPAPTRSGGAGGAPNRAPFVFFAAAAHDEVDVEMRDPETRTLYGPLSFALARALASMDEGETYRRLFERIRATIAQHSPQQTPQVEGDVDTEVFRGRAVAQQAYVSVVEARAGEVMVDAGALVGLVEGSRLAFYRAGTPSPTGTPLAEGTVSAATPYAALVALGDGADAARLGDAWGFVTWQALGDVRVGLEPEPRLAEAAALGAALATSGLVVLLDGAARQAPDAPADRLTLRAERDSLTLARAADGAVLRRLPRGEAGARGAAEAATAYARGRYLEGLRLEDPALNVRLEVRPADLRADAFGRCQPTPAAAAAWAQAHPGWTPAQGLRPGQTYALQATNTGERPAYVSVLSLRPDGEVSPLYPLQRGRDNVLGPGATFLLPVCYAASAPAGPDVLKVFVTEQPFSFDFLLNRTRGDSPRSALEQMLADLGDQEAQSTRSESVGAAPASATTTEVVLTVLP